MLNLRSDVIILYLAIRKITRQEFNQYLFPLAATHCYDNVLQGKEDQNITEKLQAYLPRHRETLQILIL